MIAARFSGRAQVRVVAAVRKSCIYSRPFHKTRPNPPGTGGTGEPSFGGESRHCRLVALVACASPSANPVGRRQAGAHGGTPGARRDTSRPDMGIWNGAAPHDRGRGPPFSRRRRAGRRPDLHRRDLAGGAAERAAAVAAASGGQGGAGAGAELVALRARLPGQRHRRRRVARARAGARARAHVRGRVPGRRGPGRRRGRRPAAAQAQRRRRPRTAGSRARPAAGRPPRRPAVTGERDGARARAAGDAEGGRGDPDRRGAGPVAARVLRRRAAGPRLLRPPRRRAGDRGGRARARERRRGDRPLGRGRGRARDAAQPRLGRHGRPASSRRRAATPSASRR